MANLKGELERKISAANEAYWNRNDPEISDSEYDALVEELKAIDPDNELVVKVKDHTISEGFKFNFGDRPMLSLNKVYSIADLIEWMGQVARGPGEEFLLQPKYDGISGCLDGDRRILATRGDGQTGEVINSKLPMLKLENWNGQNLERSELCYKSGQIRGEIIIRTDEFRKLQGSILKKDGQPYKNPRNCVAGLCNPASSDQDDRENAKRLKEQGISISFIDHDAISRTVKFGEGSKALEVAISEAWNFFHSEIPFEQDGLVVKLADREYAESLGNTSHHPKGALAFKINNESKPSRLIGIDWTLGADGSLTPTGVIEPLELDGVTVVHVLLHHFQNVVEKAAILDGGTQVGVVRSGGVIPYAASIERDLPAETPIFNKLGLEFREASPEEIADPEIFAFDLDGKKYVLLCPSCQHPLYYNEGDVDAFCRNELCREVTLKRIYNACSRSFEIDGLAESTLAKLFDQRGLRHFYDLFDLQPSDFFGIEGFAQKSAEALVDAIQLASNCTDVQVLSSLGIPMIGMNVSRDLLSEMPLEALREASVATLTQIRGIGPEKAKSLKEGLEKRKDELDQLLCRLNVHQTYSASKAATAKGVQTICFTGKAPYERSVLQELARKNGYEPVSAVTKTLSVLVTASSDSQSSKAQKARKYGTRILGFDEWFNSLENRDVQAEAEKLSASGENPLIDEIFG